MTGSADFQNSSYLFSLQHGFLRATPNHVHQRTQRISKFANGKLLVLWRSLAKPKMISNHRGGNDRNCGGVLRVAFYEVLALFLRMLVICILVLTFCIRLSKFKKTFILNHPDMR